MGMKDRDLEELAAFQKAGQEFGAEIKRSALAIRTCAENAQQTLQDDVAAKAIESILKIVGDLCKIGDWISGDMGAEYLQTLKDIEDFNKL